MKSEQLVSVLSQITYDLLYDISMGHGKESLDAPIVDANAKGPEAELSAELVKLWDGKKSLSRYDLFANVLKICSSDVDILSDIAAITAAAYPIKDDGVKLSSNGIMGLIKSCCNESAPVAPAQSNPEPAVEVEEKSPFAPIENENKPNNKVEEKSEPNYTMVKPSEKHSAAAKEHQEMLEAKRALAAERAALNS